MDEETKMAAREDHAYATGMQAVLVMVAQARSMDDLTKMIDTASGIAERLRGQSLRALKEAE